MYLFADRISPTVYILKLTHHKTVITALFLALEEARALTLILHLI